MTSPQRAPLRLTPWLDELIYGCEPARRKHIQRFMRMLALNVVASGLLLIGVILGVMPLMASCATIGYCWIGALTIYALLRSGRSRGWADPSLTYVQLMFSISAVVVSYALIEHARGAALQMLCLLLAFEMDRLSHRQLMRASLGGVAMLTLTSVVRVIVEPQEVQISAEVFNLLISAVLLPVAIVVAGEINRLFRIQIKQREQLAVTLEQLSTLSTRDALTDLTNRRQMLVLLEQEQRRQQRVAREYCLAILDIDWFKHVNDSYGHSVGDLVLQAFARLASSAIDPADTLARWGGEEFLLLMPAANASQAMACMARIRRAIAEHDWTSHAPELRVTFSAGVVVCTPEQSLIGCLEHADKALYRAKREGRDRANLARPTDAFDDPAPQAEPTKADTTCVGPPHVVGKPVSESAQALPAQTEPVVASQGSALDPPPKPDLHQSPRTKRRSWLPRLFDVVMSTDPRIREHLRLPLIAVGLHVIWLCVMHWYAIPEGVIGATAGRIVIVYETTSMLLFYPLIRSGWSARWEDGGLVLAQMVAANIITAFTYAAAPQLRASLLHLMCVIQVFGMVTLRPKASLIAGISGVLVLLGVLGFTLLDARPDAQVETLKLLLACFIIARLSMLSRDYSKIREGVAVEQVQLAQAVGQVQELLIRDALTGLFSRRHMLNLLASEFERSARTGAEFCVALIDLDHFKKINDTFGHQVGDEVLTAFARTAQATLRETDVICRWGGEEFLVLMRDTELKSQGLASLARLRKTLATVRPAPTAPDLTVTFSAGLASAARDEPLQRVLDRADQALYAAKAAGRNLDILAGAESSHLEAGQPFVPHPATSLG